MMMAKPSFSLINFGALFIIVIYYRLIIDYVWLSGSSHYNCAHFHVIKETEHDDAGSQNDFLDQSYQNDRNGIFFVIS